VNTIFKLIRVRIGKKNITRLQKGSFAANARANIDITPVSSRQIIRKERFKTRALLVTGHMSDVSNIIKSAKENLEKQFESFHSDFSRTTGTKENNDAKTTI